MIRRASRRPDLGWRINRGSAMEENEQLRTAYEQAYDAFVSDPSEANAARWLCAFNAVIQARLAALDMEETDGR
jgi:hypothetical protein